MPFELSLNIPAIISAAFICFSLLALWFSPAMFGPQIDKYRTAGHQHVTLIRLFIQAIFILLFCMVMEIFVDSVGASGMNQGIYVGVAVWLLISLIHLAVSLRFDKESMIVKGIYSAYFLAASVISATLLSMWR